MRADLTSGDLTREAFQFFGFWCWYQKRSAPSDACERKPCSSSGTTVPTIWLTAAHKGEKSFCFRESATLECSNGGYSSNVSSQWGSVTMLRTVLDVAEDRNRHFPQLVAHHPGIASSQQLPSIGVRDLQNLLAQTD